MAQRPYFHQFEHRQPPNFPAMGELRSQLWSLTAGLAIGVTLWYLYWRWSISLNPDALVFSVVIATTETLFFIGTLLFFHDIWCEEDTPQSPPPETLADIGEENSNGSINVDVYITTYDEDLEVVVPSVIAAQALQVPQNTNISIWILDDGNRLNFAQAARDLGVGYLNRLDNVGFKAGNLRNALMQTYGDFVVICDADTRVFPGFLNNTLGYFRNPQVAWVQTPHWFYDIPEGQDWIQWSFRKLNTILPTKICAPLSKGMGRILRGFSGKPTVGADPFMSESFVFFDIIQRRRNRHGASFCCGAGSVHRRKALYQGALARLGADIGKAASKLGANPHMAMATLQPFRFHVSEDIYTSILLHSDSKKKWISVYHPQVESRMLSPWSVDAWCTQKLKYAGGTFDIMLRDNPLFKRGMPLRIKLHYASTFWSYMSVFLVPIMMIAPVISMFTGWAPVSAYSLDFFAHILPVLILNELAILIGCKGYDISLGRVMALGSLPILGRAFWLVIRGRRPRFPATPKTPVFTNSGVKRMLPNIFILAVLAAAACYGVSAYFFGVEGYGAPFIIVNLFWLFWSSISLLRTVMVIFWRPNLPSSSETIGALSNATF